MIKHTWLITQYVKFSEQFTAFKYPVNMLPKVQDVLDARGSERGGLDLGRAVKQIFFFSFSSEFSNSRREGPGDYHTIVQVFPRTNIFEACFR